MFKTPSLGIPFTIRRLHVFKTSWLFVTNSAGVIQKLTSVTIKCEYVLARGILKNRMAFINGQDTTVWITETCSNFKRQTEIITSRF